MILPHCEMKDMEITIRGPLLASLFHEAYTSSSNNAGILYGKRNVWSYAVTSDDSESKDSIRRTVEISNYLKFTKPASHFGAKTCSEYSGGAAGENVVGLLLVRKDGLYCPSFRDVAFAVNLCKELKNPEHFFILIIGVPSGQSSWIHGLQYEASVLQNGYVC